MEPVVLEIMAQQGAAQAPTKRLHPLFVRSTSHDASLAAAGAHGCGHSRPVQSSAAPAAQDSSQDGRGEKKRKTDASPADNAGETHKPRRKRRSRGTGNACLERGIASHFTRLEPTSKASEQVAADSSAAIDKPQKLVYFNPQTGTLGSPPKPSQNKTSPSKTVCIKYGRDDRHRREMAAKISQILNGKLPDALSARVAHEHGGKPMHFLFAAKPKTSSSKQVQATETVQKPPTCGPSIFMSTPTPPSKKQPPTSRCHKTPLHFGSKSLGIKVPGAMHPMWPAAGMSHVRGQIGTQCSYLQRHTQNYPARKSKGCATAITLHDSILAHLMERMDLSALRHSLLQPNDAFPVPSQRLRLPQAQFESGRKLQTRISKQLKQSRVASLPVSAHESSEDELATHPSSRLHPAVARLYASLETQLSAYDRSTCESVAWTQKYAPLTAAQVLQMGKEMTLLKQWLQTMKVESIETRVDTSDERGKTKSDEALKKKRRKTKLEGFVVGSDDDASDMEELSDEADGAERAKRSVVRTVDVCRDQTKLKNTIVISGPHGCGKTAAVYAVAKELDFEVFEINSSDRRSGRDLLERVGDMTRNHLVQQDRCQASDIDADDAKVARDIESGKQGTMTTFFKSKPATQGKRQAKTNVKDRTQRTTSKSSGASSKAQKQSLILIEEADVLYEEDKQFWQTLMAMMAQSKRPFVVTCNDENLVPIQNLNLHAIFRFSPPPESLSLDVCLLIAANEGHALERKAIEALYRSRSNDLRATISELNYWCQIGVGDCRGGLGWFYSRWPKGSDVDDKGDVVRVISQNTYVRGMGWMGRDVVAAQSEPLAMEHEAMHQVWDWWQLDCSLADEPAVSGSSSAAGALAALEDFCRGLSDADTCSKGAFGSMLQEQLDATLPEMASSARDDYIVGHSLLEAEPTARLACPGAAMSMSIKSLARQILREATDVSRGPRLLDDKGASRVVQESFGSSRPELTRQILSEAFDSMAAPPKMQPATHLDPSVFDRPMKPIVLDVAPWMRAIVAYEKQLMQQRLKLSSLLSAGGTKKRMRTTRSAYSALEGGDRRKTRRERYFGSLLNGCLVMRTGAPSFAQAVAGDAGPMGWATAESP
ncbi:hypothetical protein CDD81_3678 [Ophiocordyceps australis]|uniref:AAA+ ATPase domain-containing protein n=1 Tax=Ophiocordyceps australis TaxID=1399860 RepID=A0A2C5XW30_9HYPO|nr:hypothetical protein CDD81_3678 [Ophiocordyceps australis]